ncbi:hypothetical protein Nepgr_027037 [Nepenthes gracilis]|uniref:Uncharacterized protein n=1 Tax=Nepenthes gracilis TaxID=150966 RepID=A0AAD3T9H8_NEPGR|nr:hypothetical protein Nepgr_027037 [Nepenthes gracilis]
MTADEPTVKKGMFKINNSTTSYPQLKVIVPEAWDTPVSGYPMYMVFCKLKALKAALDVITPMSVMSPWWLSKPNSAISSAKLS